MLEIYKPCGPSPSALSTKRKKLLNNMSWVVCSPLSKTFQISNSTCDVRVFCNWPPKYTSSGQILRQVSGKIFSSAVPKLLHREPYVLSLPLFQIKHQIKYVCSFLSADRKWRRLRPCLLLHFGSQKCRQKRQHVWTLALCIPENIKIFEDVSGILPLHLCSNFPGACRCLLLCSQFFQNCILPPLCLASGSFSSSNLSNFLFSAGYSNT